MKTQNNGRVHTPTNALNFTECFNVNITLARFSASSLMMVEDRNM